MMIATLYKMLSHARRSSTVIQQSQDVEFTAPMYRTVDKGTDSKPENVLQSQRLWPYPKLLLILIHLEIFCM